ncbi:MAG TPA: hypothetical protein VK308_08895 [Pyrinomonadaceae bacterium]|nr:hypothetical protein [Pyrinomonadaceae bacterium]
MINENELDHMTDEQLAEYHLQQAIEHAKTTLQMDEACFQKFGKRILSDVQKIYFQNIANGALPTDEEQITFDIESVKQAREAEKRRSLELGEAYEPTLILEDKTTGFAVN